MGDFEAGLLQSAYRKLKRGEAHIDAVRREMLEAWPGKPPALPIRREYNAVERSIIYRIEEVPRIGEEWPLLIGDAVHNLRSALDHAWWDLASHHLRRVPSEEEAPRIQFPILKKDGVWNAGSHSRWVGQEVADWVGSIQPDYSGEPQQVDALAALRHLSNVDKHRSLHLSILTGQDLVFRGPGPEDIRDCLPQERMTDQGPATYLVEGDVREPRTNQKLITVFIHPTGPCPDVDMKAEFRAFVGLANDWDVLPYLETMADAVEWILTRLLEFRVQ